MKTKLARILIEHLINQIANYEAYGHYVKAEGLRDTFLHVIDDEVKELIRLKKISIKKTLDEKESMKNR